MKKSHSKKNSQQNKQSEHELTPNKMNYVDLSNKVPKSMLRILREIKTRSIKNEQKIYNKTERNEKKKRRL